MTMAQACKRRYDMLRARACCVQCTKALPRGWDLVRCPKCHGKDQQGQSRASENRKRLAARVATLETEVAALRALVLPLERRGL